MATVDNSKIFLKGNYTDVSLYIPASTTYTAGTVLGRDADDNLTAFTSEVEGSEPIYILAQDVTNDEESAQTLDLVRVFASGEVDVNKIVFINEDDATSASVLDALKINGFILVNVQQLTVRNEE